MNSDTPYVDSKCWRENTTKASEVILAKDARTLELRCKMLERALNQIRKRTLCFKSGEIAEKALAELKEEKP